MLGSVQPGAAIYPSASMASGEAREGLKSKRSHPDWAVDVRKSRVLEQRAVLADQPW
jgi:hypothetical protein